MAEIDRVTKVVWSRQRPQVMEIANRGLTRVDVSSMSGEQIALTSSKIALYHSDASQAPGTSVEQQAKLWAMTEGRHIYKGYSACGDLVNRTLALLGLRDSRLLNRDDDDSDGIITAHEARTKWRIGKNLIKIHEGGSALGKESGYDTWNTKVMDWGLRPSVGDMPIIGGPAGGGYAHTFVVVKWDGNICHSVDGGQVDAGGQCVKYIKRQLVIDSKTGKLWFITPGQVSPDAKEVDVRIYGGRGLLGWLSVGTLHKFLTAEAYTCEDCE